MIECGFMLGNKMNLLSREEFREKAIARDKSFVLNATNTIKDMRKNWIDLFIKYGYRVKIQYVERPLQLIIKSNKTRKVPVPEEVILEKFERLDVPTLLECHTLDLHV